MTEQDLGPWEPIKDHPGVAENYAAISLYMQGLLAGEVTGDQFYAFIDANEERAAAMDAQYSELGDKTPLVVLRAHLERLAMDEKVKYAQERGYGSLALGKPDALSHSKGRSKSSRW